MSRKNISICWRTIYWVMFVLGLLIGICGLFLNVSVTLSLVTYIFTDFLTDFHPYLLNDRILLEFKFLQINMLAASILIIILSILCYKYSQKKHDQSLKLEIDYDFKKLIISSCVFFGFIIFCFSIFMQMSCVESLYYTMNGLSDDKKREILFGDFYKFVENCSEQIPENDNVLLLDGFSWHINYYLYPRKLYSYPNSSLSLENISKDWLDEKGIKWAISFNNTKFSLNDSKILKLGDENKCMI